MNSVAQIAIGTVVLGAAFVVGNQMRNQHSKSDVQAEQPDQEATEFVWQQPPYEPDDGQQVEPEQGLIDMPEARKRVPSIPGPAHLSLADSLPPQAEEQPIAPEQPSSSQAQPKPAFTKPIVEPDFSKLASSFIDTSEKQLTRPENAGDNIAPLPRLSPTDLDLKSGPPTDNTTQPVNKIADRYDIAPRSATFQASDFESQLKSAHPLAETINPIDENQPPPPIDVNSGNVVGLSNSVLSAQLARKIPLDAATPLPHDKETAIAIPVMVPQEMAAAARHGMIEVRSRQTHGLRLETNRFIRHRSKPGETLQQVSRQYYGKPDFYLDIYLANQDVLKNPGRIPTSTSLRIPVYD